MALTDRDRRIVEAVASFGVMTREQIARHHRFGSVTRANAVLLRLHRHGYLARRGQPSLLGSGRQAYVVGPLGSELLGSPAGRTGREPRAWRKRSDLFIEHELRVTDVRLAFEDCAAESYSLSSWRTPSDLRGLSLGVVPDGYAEWSLGRLAFAAFVEADLGTESRSRWREKASAYCDLAFSGRFAGALGRKFFRVLVVTTSERRAANVGGEIARQTDRIFRLATFDALLARGPLAPIWRSPASTEPQALTH